MWKAFYHPDVSLPVVRRRVGMELLELLDIFGDVSAHGAWAFLHNRTCPDTRSYHRAVGRLSKQGLIVSGRGLDTPKLKISESGSAQLAAYLHPDKRWNQKWNGIWYLLLYDVPEADRSYRNVLRQFLKTQRMGCFQKSVWVAPRDIRAQYSDLEEAAALGSFACLFEARTVLGMPAEKVVSESWDMEYLDTIQKRFCDVYTDNLKFLKETGSFDQESLMRLAAEEMDAYRSAFVLDPLLPKALLPDGYHGRKAFELHQKVIRELRQRVLGSNPD